LRRFRSKYSRIGEAIELSIRFLTFCTLKLMVPNSVVTFFVYEPALLNLNECLREYFSPQRFIMICSWRSLIWLMSSDLEWALMSWMISAKSIWKAALTYSRLTFPPLCCIAYNTTEAEGKPIILTYK